MKCVDMLRSLAFPETYYTGITDNVADRLKRHNAGDVPHTSKFAPWALKTYLAFADETQAIAFEHDLKSGSGRACAKRRL